MSEKFKIDFVGIGAEKSATCWISDCLREHPEVCFSKIKEIFFFNDYDPHFLKVRNLKYKRGLNWYKKHFSHCKEGIKGEYSPTYLYSFKTARRIKKAFPKAKIIVSLRNPADRALSQYNHDKRMGVIWNRPFEQVLKKVDSYYEKGLYHKYLSYYYKLFPKKNILVLLHDDIVKNPKKEIRKVYKFLQLKDTNYEPQSLYQKSNVSAESKYPLINYILLHTEYLLKYYRLEFILNIIEDLNIRRFAFWLSYGVNQKPLKKYPKMKKSTRKMLVNYYLDDIKSLEKLIHRRLTSWKKTD